MKKEISTIDIWWKSIDKTILYILLLMLFFGNIFVFVSSPIIAERIGISNNLFIIKNLFFSILGFLVILILSSLEQKEIIKISFIGLIVCLILMTIVLFISPLNKGAKRWIYIYGMSLQPSEIIKPFFIIISSYFLTNLKQKNNLNLIASFFLYSLIVFLLYFEPDIGMIILITSIFVIELFLMNLDIKYFYIIGIMFLILISLFYIFFPHFQVRINNYINSIFFGKTNYQIQKSINAFRNGGLFGKGPLEGSIKNYIPDAHTDFIFSVIGEEFGALFCMLIIFIYFYITIRCILKIIDYEDNFKYISVVSLSLHILFQAIINISVTLNLIPTKGITLPLISYGGSSMLSTSIIFGFLLSLTKRTFISVNKNTFLME